MSLSKADRLSGNVSASTAGGLQMSVHLFLSENKSSLESVRVRLIINCINSEM